MASGRTDEAAENTKDIVFVTITVTAEMLGEHGLLKPAATEPEKTTFQVLLRKELTDLQMEYKDICRIFLTVSSPTVFCMAGSPRKDELPGSLLADPCDAVLVEVVARCGSDITPKTLSAICDDVASFLTENTTINEKVMFKLAGGVYTPWNKIHEVTETNTCTTQ